MILDSRYLYGRDHHATPDDVRAAWQAYASDKTLPSGPVIRWQGFRMRDFALDWLDMTTEPPLPAYVNESRWCADCPACNSGIAVWADMPDGACYDCGRVWLIGFPPAVERQQAERVLDQRPDMVTRNWYPDREDVADLKAQNAVRGFVFTG